MGKIARNLGEITSAFGKGRTVAKPLFTTVKKSLFTTVLLTFNGNEVPEAARNSSMSVSVVACRIMRQLDKHISRVSMQACGTAERLQAGIFETINM